MSNIASRLKVALGTVADSRNDFYAKREALVQEESAKLDWLRNAFEVVESGVLRSDVEIDQFAEEARSRDVCALIIHLPIWADPVFALRLHVKMRLPLLILGNSRPDTSSTVGLLGTGGALDQVGARHYRVFDHEEQTGRIRVLAFVRAASTIQRLRGQRLGLFGGRSLGIFTANADAGQWVRLFGVDIEYIDQSEIMRVAQAYDDGVVKNHVRWLLENVRKVTFGGIFNADGLEKQVRSYLATRQLVKEHALDLVGVKCQRELSDGYVSQCASHMLMNGLIDAEGTKEPVVHACESDADGALSMHLLHLLSGGKPAALLDIRWFDRANNTWILANCGAMASAFYATPEDEQGTRSVQIMPHVFGEGGGGAYPGPVAPQQVTLARFCRKNGEYWLAILKGETLSLGEEDLSRTTAAFPQAKLKTNAGMDFLQTFGSNHIHMVSGEYASELVFFCELLGIEYRIWE